MEDDDDGEEGGGGGSVRDGEEVEDERQVESNNV